MKKQKSTAATSTVAKPKATKNPLKRFRSLFTDAKKTTLSIVAKARKTGTWTVFARIVAANQKSKDAKVGMVNDFPTEAEATAKFNEMIAAATAAKWQPVTKAPKAKKSKSAFESIPMAA